MKFLVPLIYQLLGHRPTRINLVRVMQFFALLAAEVAVFSVLFHYTMAYEGREYSWITGVYWTLTVMSTLGFGDITFHSDLGRAFSSVVLLGGIVSLLIVLPFTFIEFLYAPVTRALAQARAPQKLPEDTEDHIVLTELDDVANELIERFDAFRYEYVLIVPEVAEALRLSDLGYRVMVGELDDPETYRRAQADRAAFVATTGRDQLNTNVAFTVREVAQDVPILATANRAESVDILQLAGCNHVLQLADSLGRGLASRVTGPSAVANVVGQFGDVLVAEATATEQFLQGQKLGSALLRQRLGINVVGVRQRGQFRPPDAETVVSPGTVLVITGSEAAIDAFNAQYGREEAPMAPVVIIGGGRVGRAAGQHLAERGFDYRIVERMGERVLDPEHYVLGDAAAIEVLERAGIRTTSAVLVTTHDDDTNIYLTIYCRRLRPNVQILSRARLERNAVTMHRAGADFVLSYASMGATTILNLLQRSGIATVGLGLNVLSVKVPKSLAGRSLAEARVRERTGCTVIAIEEDGHYEPVLDPTLPLPADASLLLIAPEGAEERFLSRYGDEIT